MKLLISILMFPSFVSLILSGIMAGFFYTCSAMELASEYSFGGHILKGFLYAAIAAGLPLSGFSAVAGLILAAVSFIFKSWSRAVVSSCICGSGIYIWNYLLNVPYPS